MSENDIPLNPDEVVKKGEAIYQSQLKAIVEPDQNGKYLVIDVITGEHVLGDDLVQILQDARKKFPHGIFHTIRVGARGVFKVGSYKMMARYGW